MWFLCGGGIGLPPLVMYTFVNAKTISRKVTEKLARAVDFGEGKWALTRKREN